MDRHSLRRKLGADDDGRSAPCGGSRRARDPERPPYLAERDGALGGGLLAARPRGASTTSRTGCSRSGSKKGDAFAILASTSLEWCLFDFALGLVGAVGAPVYANSSPHDCAYVLDHSESVGVLVEDDEQLREGRGGPRASLPRLRHVLTFADLPELEARGRDLRGRAPGRARPTPRRQVGEDDLFTYIYTSGTTGPPKGCMIRHRNYYEMAAVRRQDAERLRRAPTTRCSSTSRSPTTSGG